MADDQATAPMPVAEIPVAESLPAGTPKATSSASRRVRARLARRMTAQRSAVNPVLEPLVAVHKEIYPKADLALLQRAYAVAKQVNDAPTVTKESHALLFGQTAR